LKKKKELKEAKLKEAQAVECANAFWNVRTCATKNYSKLKHAPPVARTRRQEARELV